MSVYTIPFRPSDIATLTKWIAIIFLLVTIVYFIQNEFQRWQSRIKGMPGPWGLPIVGSLLQIRGKSASEVYRQWQAHYGPVFQVQLGNTTFVVVNSAASAKALFIGQSAAMNSRPEFYVLHKLVSSQVSSIGTTPWDESCKRRRRAAASALNRARTAEYAGILKLEAIEFLRELLESCQNSQTEIDFRPFVKRWALNLSLTLNYGTRIADTKDMKGDPLLAEIIYVESEISRYRQTSSNLANYIPLLRYTNPILGFIGFGEDSGHGADMGARRVAYHDVLLQQLKDRIAEGTDLPCIQGTVLKDPYAKDLSKNELLSVSLSMMAGAGTNTPTLSWAILFLSHHPEVQETAYAAIQEAGILENNDFGNLKVSYIQALTKELNRYFTVSRLAIPKATSKPAYYKGATIPACTNVFLNSWACGRDSEDNDVPPWVFLPERWLASDKHSHQFAFGYGARMCVASHVAHNALYTVYLHLIAHFKILPAEGEGPETILDPLKGLLQIDVDVARPRGYKARFVPRDEMNLREYLLKQ